MNITAQMVKELREKTGVGMMDCKKALSKSDGDMEKAIKYLREKGISKAESKADRSTSEGLIYSYIHTNGKIGVMVEINCETDFVSRTDAFQDLCKDIAMHVAASNPMAVDEKGIDPGKIESEREIYRNKALNDGKPENIVDRIVDGQIKKYIQQNCLLQQEFVKDPDKTVGDIVTEAVAKLGENIQVARFVRWALGEA